MVCHVSTTKLTPRVSLCCIDNIEYKVVDLSVQISREAPFMGLNLIKRAEDGLHHHKQTITKWHFKPFPWLGHTQTNWTIEGRGLVKLPFLPHTLYLKCLSGHSSVCYKTTQNTGGVGRTGTAPPTSKLGTFLSWPLALSMSIYSNFQINGAMEDTFIENSKN